MTLRRTIRRVIGTIVLSFTLGFGWGAPAFAQWAVVDPVNLIQNALTAAHTLQQIDNQIKSLQNEAENLRALGRSFTPDVMRRLREIDGLIDEARGVALNVAETRRALDTLFTGEYAGTTAQARAVAARAQLDAARGALQSSLLLQAQTVEQIRLDRGVLEELSSTGASASGALAAQQATNELLTFQAQQSLRLQALLASQSRAEAIERAREMEVQAAARAQHQHFFSGAEAAHPDTRPWR